MKLLWPLLFVALTSLAGSPALALSITRGPYLHQSTPTSVVLVWETDAPSTSEITLGETPSSLGDRYVSSTRTTFHALRLTDLEPHHRYYYSVGSTTSVLAGGEASYFFTTAPRPSDNAPVRLWVVGDSGTGGASQGQVRDAMLNATEGAPPDLFIHVGDMAYSNGRDDEFQDHFFDVYATTLRHSVIWPALGNHEGRTSNSHNQTGPYYDAYVLPQGGEAGGIPSGTEAYYSFDYGDIHFIVLDSHQTSRAVNGTMLNWLRDDLASTSKQWLIAFWHHPPYSKGSHDSDVETRLIEMRENALPILEAGGVDLVLAGHSHLFERSLLARGAYDTPTTGPGHLLDTGDGHTEGPYQKGPNGEGAVYVVAGHGGASLYRASVHPLMAFTETIHGSCIIDINGSTLNFYNLRKDGVISDRFTLSRGDTLRVIQPLNHTEWLAGSEQTIEWRSTAPQTPVNIFFRSGSGAWQPVASSVSGGFFPWQVPQQLSESASLRIETTAAPHLVEEVTFTITDQTSLPVVAFGDLWRYHDQAMGPGSTWFTPDYNDSHWSSGHGQLGFGDGDETTLLADRTPNTPSAYFRKSFHLEALPRSAELKLLHDDGAAVWLNGSLLFSRYMHHGTTFEAWASETADDNELTLLTLSREQEALFEVGENLIAVMVKQVSGSSSDLSFDLALEVTVPAADLPPATHEDEPEESVEPEDQDPVEPEESEESVEPEESEESVEPEESEESVEPEASNQAPTLAPVGTHEVTASIPFRLQLIGSDPEGDPLRYSATGLPSSASLGPTTGALWWVPVPEDRGTRTIHFHVEDTAGNRYSQTGLFQVAAAPDSGEQSSLPEPTTTGAPPSEGVPPLPPEPAAPSGCACSSASTPPNHFIFFLPPKGSPLSRRSPPPRPDAPAPAPPRLPIILSSSSPRCSAR